MASHFQVVTQCIIKRLWSQHLWSKFDLLRYDLVFPCGVFYHTVAGFVDARPVAGLDGMFSLARRGQRV